MSAYGTAKRGSELGVQLTFPAVFENAYTGSLRFLPEANGRRLDLLVGDDFQSQYHQQKREEAHQSVRNGLVARRTAERLLLTGHQNYHLPAPVLTQRVFANPMNGVQSSSSARQDGSVRAPFQLVERGLEGGVLRTAEGQAYARAILDKRIEQLDKIDALARGQAVPAGSEKPFAQPELVGDAAKVEFNLLRQNIIASVEDGDLSRFTYADATRLLLLLFRYAPLADDDEMEDIVAGFDVLLDALRALDDRPPDVNARAQITDTYINFFEVLMEKARTYSAEMNKGVHLSPKERTDLSKALVRSLGFGRLLGRRNLATAVAVEAPRDPRLAAAVDDDENDDDQGFDRPADPREDEEQRGVPRQPFAGRNRNDNRDEFGRNSGAYLPTGRDRTAFFGEATGEADVPVVLPIRGSLSEQPAAEQAVETDERLFTETMRAVEGVLEPLGYESGVGVAPSDFIAQNYPQPSDFFAELEAVLVPAGFSKGDIARGLELIGGPAFVPYITAHKGERKTPSATKALTARDVAAQKVVMGVAAPPPTPALRATSATAAPTGAPAIPEGIPTTRAELDEKFNTKESLLKLGRSIPPELGGPISQDPRSDLKHIRRYLIYKVFRGRFVQRGLTQFKDF